VNPEEGGKLQITLGEQVSREGDMVIQTRNIYDLVYSTETSAESERLTWKTIPARFN